MVNDGNDDDSLASDTLHSGAEEGAALFSRAVAGETATSVREVGEAFPSNHIQDAEKVAEVVVGGWGGRFLVQLLVAEESLSMT